MSIIENKTYMYVGVFYGNFNSRLRKTLFDKQIAINNHSLYFLHVHFCVIFCILSSEFNLRCYCVNFFPSLYHGFQQDKSLEKETCCIFSM